MIFVSFFSSAFYFCDFHRKKNIFEQAKTQEAASSKKIFFFFIFTDFKFDLNKKETYVRRISLIKFLCFMMKKIIIHHLLIHFLRFVSVFLWVENKREKIDRLSVWRRSHMQMIQDAIKIMCLIFFFFKFSRFNDFYIISI